MWGCAAAKGPSTTAEHLVSGLRGTESLIQELFVQSSKCNGICPTRAQVVEGGGSTLVSCLVRTVTYISEGADRTKVKTSF